MAFLRLEPIRALEAVTAVLEAVMVVAIPAAVAAEQVDTLELVETEQAPTEIMLARLDQAVEAAAVGPPVTAVANRAEALVFLGRAQTELAVRPVAALRGILAAAVPGAVREPRLDTFLTAPVERMAEALGAEALAV